MKNIFLLITLVAIFSSCRTTRKITDNTRKEVEFVEEEKKDSSGSRTETTNTVTLTNTDDSSTLVIEFQPTDQDTTEGGIDRFGIDSSDYTGTKINPEDYIEFGDLKVKGKIKKLTLKKKTNTQAVENKKTEVKDTATKTAVKKIQVKETEEHKKSETTRKGIVQALVWPVFLAGLVFCVFLYFKRRKNHPPAG